LGSSLAKQLVRSGYRVVELVSRGNSQAARRLARQLKARAYTLENARLNARVVWFCVPDRVIARCAGRLENRDWRGRVAFHSSGVLGSDALKVLARQGAKLASVHPLMTFVRNSSPDLKTVAFALEGERHALGVAANIVRDLGGEVLLLKRSDKIAYHAFATMICPLLISLFAAAEAVAAKAGLVGKKTRRLASPIIEQTLANYRNLGPARSFTGPIARGDLETVSRHLKLLTKIPPSLGAYLGLAEAALKYLPSANRRKLESLLKQAASETAGRNLTGKGLASRRASARC
jgi:predicted short-subunit dehydrogenase-like oxidoreductase (DUF2520 family)